MSVRFNTLSTILCRRTLRRKGIIIEPADFVRYVATFHNVDVSEFKLPQVGVLAFNPRILELLISELKAIHKPWLYRAEIKPLCNPFIASLEVMEVVLMLPGWGAPRAASVMEEMIACGTREFIALGYCGSLVEGINVGDVIIPTSAFVDEGTSKHYVAGVRTSAPDETMVKSLVSACEKLGLKYYIGSIWSTDAPYMETKRRVLRYRRQGAIAVDMETSAIFTLATYRKIKAAALHIVSDSLSKLKWEPTMRSAALNEALKMLPGIVREAIKSL